MKWGDSDSVDRRIEAVRQRIAQLDKITTADGKRFGDTINEIVHLKVEEEALLIVKKIIIDFFSHVVERTPVDTGRAAASWQFGQSSEPLGEVPEGEYKARLESIVSGYVAEIMNARHGVWFISNHLKYIEALEVGWSKQAPHGMVALSLRELTRQLKERMAL